MIKDVEMTLHTGTIVLVKVDDECARCIEQGENIYVPHFNCLYQGRYAVGHSATHCTADACY